MTVVFFDNVDVDCVEVDCEDEDIEEIAADVMGSVDVDRIVETDVSVDIDVDCGMIISKEEEEETVEELEDEDDDDVDEDEKEEEDDDEDVVVDVLLISVFVVDAGSAEGVIRLIAVVLDIVVVITTDTGMVRKTGPTEMIHCGRPMVAMNFLSASEIAAVPSLSRKAYETFVTGTGADVTVAQKAAPPAEPGLLTR